MVYTTRRVLLSPEVTCCVREFLAGNSKAPLLADLPDTSIADTSTEDLNTSQDSQPDSEKGDNAEKGEAEPEKKPEDGEPEAAKEPMEVSCRFKRSKKIKGGRL